MPRGFSVLAIGPRRGFGCFLSPTRQPPPSCLYIEYAAFCGMMLIRPQLDRETLLRLSHTLNGLMRRHADDKCGGSPAGSGQELAPDQKPCHEGDQP